MKKILTILFVCFYSICLSQSTDSTKIFYTKEDCKEIFLLTFEIIDNGTISEYPKEKMTKITNVLCDCFFPYTYSIGFEPIPYGGGITKSMESYH